MSKLSVLQQILSGKPEPIAARQQQPQSSPNPFLKSTVFSQNANDEVGVNRPLRHPMFVGYRNNAPVYAGSVLSVLI